MKKKILSWSLLITISCLNTPSSLRADDSGTSSEEPVNPLENSLETPEYVDPYADDEDETEEAPAEESTSTATEETTEAPSEENTSTTTEEATETPAAEETQPVPDEYEENVDPQGTAVAPAQTSQEDAKKKELYKNILLAAFSVVIATVSIIIVSNNNGTKN